MGERDDAIARLDQVVYGLDEVAYRQERRHALHKSIRRISGVAVLIDLLAIAATVLLSILGMDALAESVFSLAVFLVFLSFPVWLLSLAIIVTNTSIGATRDTVQKQLLLTERRKILDEMEVRGALQVHTEVDEATGGLSLHDDSAGGLTEA